MKGLGTIFVLGLAAIALTPAGARIDSTADARKHRKPAVAEPTLLQCVPYARDVTGIALYGDAHTWWDKARGRYARGKTPKVGAVLTIRPYANSKLGHVAAVSRIVDVRTILISHANWSIPGKIERNVTVLDVSPRNDWSEVRVWYGPNQNLGTTHWPVAGFIYNNAPGKNEEAGPAKAERKTDKLPSAHKDRKKDPIGAIIAGRY